jgi:hypothetical protein
MKPIEVDAVWSKKLAQASLPRGRYEAIRRRFGQPTLVVIDDKAGFSALR